jgi:hypothetical protein
VTAVVVEVVVHIVAVRTSVLATVRTAVPAVRTTVAAPAFAGTSTAGSALSRTAATESGQRLGDGFGGIRPCSIRLSRIRGGVVRFGGHGSILHAT